MTTISTTTPSITTTPEDRALKAKHAAMWASGSYRTVVDEIVAPLGGILVETVDVQPGQRVLDVAAGTGSSALPAVRRGAEVTATDLTPELLDVGRAAAARPTSSSSAVRSVAVTNAPRRAAGSAAVPVPAATSRTVWPGRMSTASTRLVPSDQTTSSTTFG